MSHRATESPNMLSLRISRWRQPRLSWLAVVMVAIVCLGFGVVAHALHPELGGAQSEFQSAVDHWLRHVA